MVLTPEQVLKLAEVRNDLLIRLSDLHSPTIALERLAQFKKDVGGAADIDATLAKWTRRTNDYT